MAFVLVHGGGMGGSCWGRLTSLLNGTVVAPDLPGRKPPQPGQPNVTVADFVDTVTDVIVRNDLHDVVLIGHSMAGITLPRVAGRVASRLRRLVFVSCTVPPQGTTVASTLNPEVYSMVGETNSYEEFTRAFALRFYCNDMDDEQKEFTLAQLTPEALDVINEPSDLSGLRWGTPRTWVKCLQDQIVTPAKQDQFIEAIGGADVIEINAGHMPMISRPDELALILNGL